MPPRWAATLVTKLTDAWPYYYYACHVPPRNFRPQRLEQKIVVNVPTLMQKVLPTASNGSKQVIVLVMN